LPQIQKPRKYAILRCNIQTNYEEGAQPPPRPYSLGTSTPFQIASSAPAFTNNCDFQSRDFHERGKRHQENVQKKLNEVML